MFKRLVFVIVLFVSFNSYGQDINELRKKASNSTDSELIVFIQKAKDQGLSLIDAEKQLVIIGGKAQEIKKLRELWNKKLPISSSTNLLNSEEIQSNFGDTEAFVEDSLDIKDQVEEIKRFGSDFFKNKNITESPQLFVATPSDYRLGPGDELIVNLFGASEITYAVQISRNGNVKFDKLAPVYLSGLSIRSATKRLKLRLSKIYTGLNSSNSIEKVDLELSLQKARSIVVNITGQVEAPGTYTISGFSSVLNALYAAGGPNEIGTYRDIKVIRSGKIVYSVDLYDYFANGIYPNVFLRDQDVILVKPYQIQTELVSGFKQLSLFEMKENETVSDLINLSGGLSSNAFKSAIFIERFNDFSKSILEFDRNNFSNSKLIDGDKISFKEIKDKNILGIVKIGGAVNLQGNFQLNKNTNISELINSAKGFSNDKLGVNAVLYRNSDGFDNESISINLDDNEEMLTLLVENDSLYVPSSKDILFDQVIEIKGEVNFPKEIDFRYGLTITDLIVLSGGLTPFANKNDIRIFRNTSQAGGNKVTEEILIKINDNLVPNKKILLLPDDIVTVNTFPFRRENKFYNVKGEVALPGLYSIKNQYYTTKDAFKENIKLTDAASVYGIFVERDSIKIPVKGKSLYLKDNETLFFEPEEELVLLNGDIINIPTFNNTVLITGAVQQESIISFEKTTSFRRAVISSGGTTENADFKRGYIEYQNGLKKSVRSFFGIKTFPKVLPGSKIVIPEKDQNRDKTSLGEIVGYTTSLVSVIALIKSL